jgi:hypothetical protein
MWNIMARRAKKMKTQRFLYYSLAHSGNGSDDHYIDLAKDLSATNRRLYRQGMEYSISNISVHDSQGDAQVLVSTAPSTWATHESWQLAFDGWKRQRALLLEEAGGNMQTPRWSDFKVYLNKEHVYDSDWPSVDDDGSQAILGTGANNGAEWEYADMSFNKGGSRFDDHAIGLLGAHQFSSITNETSPHDTSYDGYISCIEGLQEVRTKPVQEAGYDLVATQSPFSGFNLLSPAAILDNLTEIIDEGDNPPYSLEFVGSNTNPADDTGAFPVRECHISSTYSPMAMMGPIPNIPCGLMQVRTTASANNTIGLLIELTPGDYKGVHATPMGN